MNRDQKCCKNYQIYEDVNTGMFGVRDTNMDTTVFKCVFDNIEFYKESNLIKFTMKDMESICSIDDISAIAVGLDRQY